jgi:hypothetical protein
MGVGNAVRAWRPTQAKANAAPSRLTWFCVGVGAAVGVPVHYLGLQEPAWACARSVWSGDGAAESLWRFVSALASDDSGGWDGVLLRLLVGVCGTAESREVFVATGGLPVLVQALRRLRALPPSHASREGLLRQGHALLTLLSSDSPTLKHAVVAALTADDWLYLIDVDDGALVAALVDTIRSGASVVAPLRPSLLPAAVRALRDATDAASLRDTAVEALAALLRSSLQACTDASLVADVVAACYTVISGASHAPTTKLQCLRLLRAALHAPATRDSGAADGTPAAAVDVDGDGALLRALLACATDCTVAVTQLCASLPSASETPAAASTVAARLDRHGAGAVVVASSDASVAAGPSSSTETAAAALVARSAAGLRLQVALQCIEALADVAASPAHRGTAASSTFEEVVRCMQSYLAASLPLVQSPVPRPVTAEGVPTAMPRASVNPRVSLLRCRALASIMSAWRCLQWWQQWTRRGAVSRSLCCCGRASASTATAAARWTCGSACRATRSSSPPTTWTARARSCGGASLCPPTAACCPLRRS